MKAKKADKAQTAHRGAGETIDAANANELHIYAADRSAFVCVFAP